jgi:hypothetical protein
MQVAHIAECSEGKINTPGLYAMTKAVLGAVAPTVVLTFNEVEQSITELAQMGRTQDAERLSQMVR